MRYEGLIRSWNDPKGFGFIRIKTESSNRQRQDIFVHISQFDTYSPRPQVGDTVTFEQGPGKNGKTQALNVSLTGHSPYKARKIWISVPVLIALAIGVGIITPYRLLILLTVFIVLNLLTITAYRIDKRAAQSDNGRISEGTLLLLGLIGGWPGAILSQQWFRHKTAKSSFQWLFWGSVILNISVCILAGYLLSQI